MSFTTHFSAHINKRSPYSKEPLNYANMIAHNNRLNTFKSKHIRKELSANNISFKYDNTYFKKVNINGVIYNDVSDYFKRIHELYREKYNKKMSKLVNNCHEIILNLTHNTTKDQLDEYGEYLKSIGYTLIEYSYHADELDETIEIDDIGDYKEAINYHAHYIVSPLTIYQENGKEVYKNINGSLSRTVLKNMQDAGAKIFGMERGIKGSKTKNIPSAHLRALKRMEVALEDELFKNLTNKLENINKVSDIDKIVKDYISALYNDNKNQLMELKASRDDYRVSENDMKDFKNVMANIIKSMKSIYKAKKGNVVDEEFHKLLREIAKATICLKTKQKTQIKQLKETINELKSKLSESEENNKKLSDVVSKYEENNKNIDDIKGSYIALNNKYKDIENKYNTAMQEIDKLNGVIKNNEIETVSNLIKLKQLDTEFTNRDKELSDILRQNDKNYKNLVGYKSNFEYISNNIINSISIIKNIPNNTFEENKEEIYKYTIKYNIKPKIELFIQRTFNNVLEVFKKYNEVILKIHDIKNPSKDYQNNIKNKSNNYDFGL